VRLGVLIRVSCRAQALAVETYTLEELGMVEAPTAIAV